MSYKIDESHRAALNDLELPQRLLLGPGPSNPNPKVLSAIGSEVVGHLDPVFVNLMSEIQELLRYVFQTDNELTIPISGTGSAAMEASVANTLEPGDVILIAVNGYFIASFKFSTIYSANFMNVINQQIPAADNTNFT